jgi:4-diphosphocytidyl-2-C-methyl-D-erythritol kinase
MTRANEIRIFAPAKVNLFLELLGRRPDGYHELETLMCSVDLVDEIAINAGSPNAPDALTVKAQWADGLVANREPHCAAAFGPLPQPEKNLAHRALELLRQECGVTEGASIHLTKRIPAEAGLGGASSDAATALIAGKRFWKLGLSVAQLAQFAAKLGSDVPFFLHGGWAICRGRGEIIEPLENMPPIWVVIVRPPFGLSTPKVYSRCEVPMKPCSSLQLIECLQNRDETALAGQLVNRLWAPALAIESRLAAFPAAFHEAGLRAHQMSGSGSSYFGVTFDRTRALRAAAILRSRNLGFVAVAKAGTKNACILDADTLSS